MRRPLLCECLVVVDLDLLEGVATGDGEETFTAVLGAVLRDDIDLVIPEGEVLADIPELRAIDVVVSLIDDELLGGMNIGQ